jgi:hypothetical protein
MLETFVPPHLKHVCQKVWVDAEVWDAPHQVRSSACDAKRLTLAAQEANHTRCNAGRRKHSACGQPVKPQPAAFEHEFDGKQCTSCWGIKGSRHTCSQSTRQDKQESHGDVAPCVATGMFVCCNISQRPPAAHTANDIDMHSVKR